MVTKLTIMDSIIDFCSVPRTMGDIAEQFENERSYRAVAAYIKEMVRDGDLFVVPKLPGQAKRTEYLNFMPSDVQVLTGEYKDIKETEGGLKTFLIDSSITGDGYTTFPSISLYLSTLPSVADIWQTVHDFMLLKGWSDDLENNGYLHRASLNRGFQTYRLLLSVILGVIEQIEKDNRLQSPKDSTEKLGLSDEIRDTKELGLAYGRLARKMLITVRDPDRITKEVDSQ